MQNNQNLMHLRQNNQNLIHFHLVCCCHPLECSLLCEGGGGVVVPLNSGVAKQRLIQLLCQTASLLLGYLLRFNSCQPWDLYSGFAFVGCPVFFFVLYLLALCQSGLVVFLLLTCSFILFYFILFINIVKLFYKNAFSIYKDSPIVKLFYKYFFIYL